jgi:hypothetical protein
VRGIPAVSAAPICAQASSSLVAKAISFGTLASLFIIGPLARQIQPIVQWQTDLDSGQRQAHCDLAVIDLTQPPTALSRHTNRMLAILAKARVIDNPRSMVPALFGSAPTHLRAPPPRATPYRSTRCWRPSDASIDAPSAHPAGEPAPPIGSTLSTLSRQHQSLQIPERRRRPIRMPQRLDHHIGVAFESQSHILTYGTPHRLHEDLATVPCFDNTAQVGSMCPRLLEVPL